MTVGHSTHPIDAFRESLHDAGVRQVADVRRFPGSRRHPQYGAAALTAALREVGIGYEHVAALGGRRPVLPGSCNGGWQTAGFPRLRRPRAHRHFAEGLARLEELAAERRVAVMCAEILVALPPPGPRRRAVSPRLGRPSPDAGRAAVAHQPREFMIEGENGLPWYPAVGH